MIEKNSISQIIGNTPLIYLKQVSELTGCDIYGKAEFLNPGGSVKDRTALGIIRDAQQRGELQPGGVIVEGTAGNTGIGLTLLANALGYRSVVVMPQTESKEKIEMLDLIGAELHLVPPAKFEAPNHYVNTAKRIAASLAEKESNGAIWARQFENPANMDIHYQSTGAEIWSQTEGQVDGFICASGTGGTIAGVSNYLKEKNPNVKIGLADPEGSALFSHFTEGELKSEGSSIAEGIGISFVTENYRHAKVDFAYSISDKEGLPFIFNLLKLEGLCMGGSSAINIAGAARMARELGPGHTIVTILCDYGTRYQSTLYNLRFLQRRGLPTPDWMRD